MKKGHRLWLLLVVGGLLLVGAVLVSCAPDTSAPELRAEVPQDSISDDQSDILISSGPDADLAIEPFVDQACLDCHSDQELLMELAVEEEVPEIPSEGPG
jgi:hypothetical protein